MPEPTPDVVLCKAHDELLPSLLDLGARVHLVVDRFDERGAQAQVRHWSRCASLHRIGSFDSIEELATLAVDLREVSSRTPIVLSHHEMTQFAAGYLRMLLGGATGSPGDGADPLDHVSHRDKRLMKERVRAAGAAVTGFVSIDPRTDDDDRIRSLVATLRPPLVVKPVAGLGGVNTVRVDDPAELASVSRRLGVDPLVHARGLMVEEFVTGYEVAVDAIWSDGEELSLVAHRYHENRLRIAEPTETTVDGSRVLVPEDEPELYERVRALHAVVNPALGIRDCATHLEVFVQPDGRVVFSEIAARAGGAWIPDLLSCWLGRPLWSLVAQGAVLGRCEPFVRRYPYVASVSLHPAEPGVVESLPEPEELRARPEIVRWQYVQHAGGRARRHHPSDYYLHLILTAGTVQELTEACAAAVRDLKVVTRPA